MSTVKFDLLSDEELIENVKRDNYLYESLTELKDRHSGVFYQKFNKFLSTGHPEIMDIRECPLTFFYDAVFEYKPEKGKFVTFVGNKAFYTCHNTWRKIKNRVSKTVSLDGQEDSGGEELFHLHMEEDFTQDEKTLFDHEVLSYILEDIEDETEKKIFRLRSEGFTFKEISEKIDNKYTGYWCSILFQNIVEKYKKILEEELR